MSMPTSVGNCNRPSLDRSRRGRRFRATTARVPAPPRDTGTRAAHGAFPAGRLSAASPSHGRRQLRPWYVWPPDGAAAPTAQYPPLAGVGGAAVTTPRAGCRWGRRSLTCSAGPAAAPSVSLQPLDAAARARDRRAAAGTDTGETGGRRDLAVLQRGGTCHRAAEAVK